jgi:type I restriction enzyme S subunit
MTQVSRVGVVRLGRQRSPDKHTGRFPTKYLRAANITPAGLDLSDVLEMDFTPAEREVYTLRTGDVLLTEASGSSSQVGRAAVWGGQIPGCCFQNTVIRFRPHATTGEYALVVFRHYAASGVFGSVARGVGIQHLGASRFAELPFPLPPLAEQRRIAAEVERRLVETRGAESSLRAALDKIEEQRREILSAAVSGDLVETEAAVAARVGRPADAPGIPVISPGEDAPQGFLFDTDEPPIVRGSEALDVPLPPGWIWTRVGALGEVKLGKQLSPEQARGPKLRKYLRVANVQENRIDVADVKRMHFSDEEYRDYRLELGDILLNEGQSLELVGRPAIYRGEVPGACFQNTLIRVRTHPWADADFVLMVFRHYLHSGEFQKIAHRSTNIAHLGLQRLAAMPFPLPPLTEQRRIAAEVRRRLDSSDAQEVAVRASLERLPDMEREIFAAAVSGTLVPHDPGDEPAEILLLRVGPPEPDTPARRTDQPPKAAMNRPRSTKRGAIQKRELATALRAAGKPLRVPELFAFAGYNRDDVGEVEQFYIALRRELERRTVRRVGGEGEDALLEAMTDAT